MVQSAGMRLALVDATARALRTGYTAAMPTPRHRFPGPLTGRAAVLAVLLSKADQTGAEPLQGHTTLPVIIRSLKRKYRWPIETASFPANDADGGATWATVYRLPPEIVAAALDAGGREWLDRRAAAKGMRAGIPT
jgi:hypothetical protein